MGITVELIMFDSPFKHVTQVKAIKIPASEIVIKKAQIIRAIIYFYDFFFAFIKRL